MRTPPLPTSVLDAHHWVSSLRVASPTSRRSSLERLGADADAARALLRRYTATSDPRIRADALAAFLRDRGLAAPTDVEVEAAAGRLELSGPTAALLLEGGDDRLELDGDDGRTPYGIAPGPLPDGALSYASCTASMPTPAGFEAASTYRERHLKGGTLDADRLHDEVARDLVGLLGLDVPAERVVLLPSGTDAEYVAIVAGLVDAAPDTELVNVVVGPDETGSGTTLAAGGRWFSAMRPVGARGEPKAPFDGLPVDRLTVEEVPLRDADGEPRARQALEEEIEAHVRRAVERSARVVVHVVEGSKTGLTAPRQATVARWMEEFGRAVTVLVDAAQLRVPPAVLAAYLDLGCPLLVTGSKALGGPPFSGALVLDERTLARLRTVTRWPAGFADLLATADVPPTLPRLRSVTRTPTNWGLLARWEAALAQWRELDELPADRTDEMVAWYGYTVPGLIDATPGLRLVEHDRTAPGVLPLWTVLIEDDEGRPRDRAALKRIHRRIQRPDGDAPAVYVGQPVPIGRSGAALRLAVGAPDVVRADTIGVEAERARLVAALGRLARGR